MDHFSGIGFSCPLNSNPGGKCKRRELSFFVFFLIDYLMRIMHGGNEKNVKNYPIYFEGYDSKLK